MDKKIILTTILFSVVVLILGYVVVGSMQNKNNQNNSTTINLPSKEKIVFYYGITCPHCKDVEEWMKKNKVEEKIKIEKKEVYQNQKNNQELEEVAKSCGLNTMMIGVPFLYTDGKCYIGTPEVIKVLSDKSKIKNQNAK
jgi:glutaredoxin